MAQIHYIKDLYENEDLSLREIARRTQHSFSTVQKYAYQEDWSEDTLPNVAPEDYPILGAYIPCINEWMEADRKVPRKQRHTAKRIYDRLCKEKGYTGSYSSVKRYVRNGSIITFHDQPKSWRNIQEALPASIEYLIGQGYEFRTL